MAGLCKYKDVFGAPGTGAHSLRFMGLAIVDVVLTVLGAAAVAWFTEWPFWYVVAGAFISGIVVHKLFCVRTTIDKLLFA